jgi:hypothetical protein
VLLGVSIVYKTGEAGIGPRSVNMLRSLEARKVRRDDRPDGIGNRRIPRPILETLTSNRVTEIDPAILISESEKYLCKETPLSSMDVSSWTRRDLNRLNKLWNFRYMH